MGLPTDYEGTIGFELMSLRLGKNTTKTARKRIMDIIEYALKDPDGFKVNGTVYKLNPKNSGEVIGDDYE